jgi:hypothetical protein
MGNKLTPFAKFTIELLQKEPEPINPNYLASLWAMQNGRKCSASRDMFGYTSSAYKMLRKLAENKIAIRTTYRTRGGYLVEQFTYNKKIK